MAEDDLAAALAMSMEPNEAEDARADGVDMSCQCSLLWLLFHRYRDHVIGRCFWCGFDPMEVLVVLQFIITEMLSPL